MSKLNNSSPRPASFLQPSPGARASPRVPPRRALTLVTAGTVETWSGAARRRPNLISRGSTLARGAAHHRVIMLSERINENIYLQSVLQWPMTLLSSIYQVSWFKIHLHSHLRLSAKTGTLIEETKTEWKKWQIFHTRLLQELRNKKDWDFSYQLVLWNLNMYGIWKWLASVMLLKTYLFTVFKLASFSEDEQWREVLSRECDSSSVDTRTRGHVHLILASAPASVSPWLSSGSTPSAWSTSPTWSSRSVDIVIPGDIIAVVLLLLWKTTKLIFFCFIRSLSRKSKAIIYIILNVHFDTMYNSRLCSFTDFTPSPCRREPHIWPTNYMLFSF